MTEYGFGLAKPPHHLVVFDPGKATGWAKFIDGVFNDWGICRTLPALDTFLLDYVANHGTPDKILWENFIVFGNKAQKQTGSKMEAPQAIGKLKLWSNMLGIEPEEPQMSNVLPLAIKWSGVKLGSHRDSHNKSALNHGVYWLVRHDMMVPGGMD